MRGGRGHGVVTEKKNITKMLSIRCNIFRLGKCRPMAIVNGRAISKNQMHFMNNIIKIVWTNSIVQHEFSSSTTNFEEKKIAVNGIDINYVREGDGEHALLCLPGALGSIWSDFKPQIEGLDKTKFTVVAWDPPGYGHSRPPVRDFAGDFFVRDADCAVQLMKNLSLDKFSLVGWSDGGITSMIIAGKYPENVEKMVIWGANAYIVDDDVKIYESIRDVSRWSTKMKAPLIKLYGEEYFVETWNRWVDAFVEIHSQGGDICRASLPLVRCPTFVLHGDKDPMLAAEHTAYLIDNIKNTKYHAFEDGKHNIHLRYAEEFNKLVEEFLLHK